MSKLSRYVNGCVGKKRYSRLRDAERYARWVARKFGDVQSPYFCEDCGYWHLGHSIQKGTKK